MNSGLTVANSFLLALVGALLLAASAVDHQERATHRYVRVSDRINPEPTAELWLDDDEIEQGETTVLHWDSEYAGYCVGDNFDTNDHTSGSKIVGPQETIEYTVTCYDEGGREASASSTLTVTEPDKIIPEVELYADPIEIKEGESSTLHWNSENAVSCTSEGFDTAGQTSGSVSTGALYQDTTFVVECESETGHLASASVTVWVSEPEYEIIPLVEYSADPSVTLEAEPSTITEGQSSTLTWESEHAVICYSPNFESEYELSGTIVVSPESATTYDIICENAVGDQVASSATVTVEAMDQMARAAQLQRVLQNRGLEEEAPIPNFDLTTQVAGQGSVEPESATAAQGTALTVTATAAEGWDFGHWSGDLEALSQGTSTDSEIEVTLASDVQLTAHFEEEEPEPEVTASISAYPSTVNQGGFSLTWGSSGSSPYGTEV